MTCIQSKVLRHMPTVDTSTSPAVKKSCTKLFIIFFIEKITHFKRGTILSFFLINILTFYDVILSYLSYAVEELPFLSKRTAVCIYRSLFHELTSLIIRYTPIIMPYAIVFSHNIYTDVTPSWLIFR